MRETSIKEWIARFQNNEFASRDKNTQIKAGWYDWFCSYESLRNRLYKMGKIVSKVKEGGKVDMNNWYVWFKNNCPFVGPLYDDFRFADIETGEVQFTISIDEKRTGHKYNVWGRRNQFQGPIIQFEDSRDLVKWLNTPWEE